MYELLAKLPRQKALLHAMATLLQGIMIGSCR
jgi:hypothetical protein